MAAIQNSILFWLGLIGLLAFLAVLPTLIASSAEPTTSATSS
ncbi:hypothetical protein [Actinomadura macra]|nr:hypothetical protein [Actinomadura macra]